MGTWKFNPTTAALFISTMEDIKGAYEQSHEDGDALVDLLCYILKGSISLDAREKLTDIPSTLNKLGLNDPEDIH